MNSVKLLPCPFCGSKNPFEDWGAVKEGDLPYQYGDITCQDCQASVCIELTGTEVDTVNGSKRLASLWNKRTASQKEVNLVLENEMLREKLRRKEREVGNLNRLSRIQDRNLSRYREDDCVMKIKHRGLELDTGREIEGWYVEEHGYVMIEGVPDLNQPVTRHYLYQDGIKLEVAETTLEPILEVNYE